MWTPWQGLISICFKHILAAVVIINDNNGRGTLCPSDIGNKWKANVSVARMNDVHILSEIIEIRDDFKECCILSKEDVSDIIENLTVF